MNRSNVDMNVKENLAKLMTTFSECSQNVETLLKELNGFSQSLEKFNSLYKKSMELGDNTKDIAIMSNNMEKLNANLVSTTTNITQFMGHFNSNITKVNSVNTSLQDTAQKLDVIQNEISRAKNNTDNIKQTTNSISSDISNIKDEIAAVDKTLTMEFLEISQGIQAISNEIKDSYATNKNKLENIKHFLDQYNSNMIQLSLVNTSITDAMQTFANIGAEITETQSNTNSLKNTAATISEDISFVKQELVTTDKIVAENYQEISQGVRILSDDIKNSFATHKGTLEKLDIELNTFNTTLSTELKQTLENTTSLKELFEKATEDSNRATEFFFELIDQWASKNIRGYKILRRM